MTRIAWTPWARRSLGILIVLGGVGLGPPTQARGQTRVPSDVISSDRPGLGDAAHVLAPGVWQVELGGTIHSQGADDFLVGNSLLRVGLAKAELRLFLPDIVTLRRDEFLRLGDVGVGAKFPLDLGGGWRWAGTGTLTVPTGAKSLSAKHPGAGASLIAERGLSSTVGLALNAGYGFLFDGPGDGTLSFLVTPSFGVPDHEGLSLFAGYALYVRPGDDAHYLEAGLAKLDGPDRQWDVNAGYDPAGHVWFLGVGVAGRRR